VSVRKVIPTLTSNQRCDLPLDGPVLATNDTGFILVPAGAVRPVVVCSGHCIASHRGTRRGGYKRGGRGGKCQYRGEGRERLGDRCPSSRVPVAGGLPLLL
jgi:hypothetical protein